MINLFTLLLVLMIFAFFLIIFKQVSQNTEKRIEDFKEGFSKGYEAINHITPFVEKEVQPSAEGYTDEELYYMEAEENSSYEKPRVEYVDREDEWRD